MPGVQEAYMASNADVLIHFTDNPWCIMYGWFPADYRTRTGMKCLVRVHGGGWDGPSFIPWAAIHQPNAEMLAGGDDAIMSRLIAAGWCVFTLEFPTGFNVSDRLRYWPLSRFPHTERAIGMAIQYLKSHAEDGKITRSRASTLSTREQDYAFKNNSSGALMGMWVTFMPDKWLPYYDTYVQHAGGDPFLYRFNHRVRAFINEGGASDFTKFNSSGISAAALAHFGARERFPGNPAFAFIPRSEKLDASSQPLLELNDVANQGIALFFDFSLESAVGDSILSSGTVVYGQPTIAPSAGDTYLATPSGSNGTVIGYNAAVPCVYLERADTTLLDNNPVGGADTITFSSGGTLSISGATVGQNVNYPEFLTEDEAVLGGGNPLYGDGNSIWDIADVDKDEIVDLTTPHDLIFLLAMSRQLKRNDEKNKRPTSKHKFYGGNDHTASLCPVLLDGPAFGYVGGDLDQAEFDWLEEVTG